MKFGCGIVEGFYGRQWNWQMRENWVRFLADEQLNTYIYAPKSDPWLRQRWRERPPPEHLRQLQHFGSICRHSGIRWGLGLSPLKLQQQPELEREFTTRLSQWMQLQPDLLCILFDDMRTAKAEVAARQSRLVNLAREITGHNTQLVMCPSWYSNDPQLLELLGPMPEQYLETLGSELSQEVGIIWCGELVCPASQPPAHYAEMAAKLRRKPVIWDNYPVNDGRQAIFLNTAPFANRPPALRTHCAGHWVNPMNQSTLSQLPLSTFASLQRQGSDYIPEKAWDEALQRLCPAKLQTLLRRDSKLFQQQGLPSLSESRRQALNAEYSALKHPAAAEIAEWLAGEYRFDFSELELH